MSLGRELNTAARNAIEAASAVRIQPYVELMRKAAEEGKFSCVLTVKKDQLDDVKYLCAVHRITLEKSVQLPDSLCIEGKEVYVTVSWHTI